MSIYRDVLGKDSLAAVDALTWVAVAQSNLRHFAEAHANHIRLGGIGAEVAAIAAERALEDLLAPVKRVGTKPVPVPSGAIRKHALPTVEQVVAAARELMAGSAK